MGTEPGRRFAPMLALRGACTVLMQGPLLLFFFCWFRRLLLPLSSSAEAIFFFFPSQLVLPPAAVPDLVGQGERGGCLAHGWTARRSHGESRRCGCAVAAAAATATAAAVARCGLGGPAGTRRRAGRVAAGGGGTRPPWGHLSRSGHPTRAYPPPPSTITAAAHRRRPPSCVTCTITGGRTQWSASSPQRRWLLLFSVVVRLRKS